MSNQSPCVLPKFFKEKLPTNHPCHSMVQMLQILSSTSLDCFEEIGADPRQIAVAVQRINQAVATVEAYIIQHEKSIEQFEQYKNSVNNLEVDKQYQNILASLTSQIEDLLKDLKHVSQPRQNQ